MISVEEGLFRSRTNKKYALELKLEVLELHQTSEIPMREIANKLGIKNLPQISLCNRSYERKGVAGLQRKRGRPELKRKKICLKTIPNLLKI